MTELSPPLPDLQIFVRRVTPNDPKRLIFEVRAANPALKLNLREYGPVQLDLTPEEYVQSSFNEIRYLLLRTEEDRQTAARKIEGKGGTLFAKLLPDDLQQLLWSLRGNDQKALSLQIVSDDPHIPWELMRLRGRDGRGWISGPFLCEAFALTRWVRSVPEVHALPVKRLALVVSKPPRLPSLAGEREDLLALQGQDREVTEIPAKYQQVLDVLATGAYDAWHFGGHGGEIGDYDRDADLWRVELDDYRYLTPEDLAEAPNLGQFHPLIFFNGCNSGRSGRSLAGMGGWPAALLHAGAGAFVGAVWAVRDSKARTFAQVFYELFLSGTPIGEAVRQARLRIKSGNPTWLAYTVFAHPLATCTGKVVRAKAPIWEMEEAERLIDDLSEGQLEMLLQALESARIETSGPACMLGDRRARAKHWLELEARRGGEDWLHFLELVLWARSPLYPFDPSLRGWVPRPSGVWQVVKDWIVGMGVDPWVFADPPDLRLGSLITWEGLRFRGGSLATQLRTSAFHVSTGAGLVLCHDGQTALLAVLRSSEGMDISLDLFQRQGNRLKPLESAPLPQAARENEWHDLRLRVDGRRVTAGSGDVEVSSLLTANPPAGYLGLMKFGNSFVHFANLRLEVFARHI